MRKLNKKTCDYYFEYCDKEMFHFPKVEFYCYKDEDKIYCVFKKARWLNKRDKANGKPTILKGTDNNIFIIHDYCTKNYLQAFDNHFEFGRVFEDGLMRLYHDVLKYPLGYKVEELWPIGSW